MMLRIIILFTIGILFFSCLNKSSESTKEIVPPSLPEITYNYINHESSNPQRTGVSLQSKLGQKNVTNEIATLGRVLFYDNKLSLNNRVSCGSCHNQRLGFSDGEKVSIGFNNGITSRNSMSISNLLFSNGFFWDRRETRLNEQVIKPIQNHIEMGLTDMKYLEDKLMRIEYYPELFYEAYGEYEITEDRVAIALTQFIQTMLSHNSPFDKGELSELQLQGEKLFKKNCQSCHTEPSVSSSWSSTGAANIGLDVTYSDKGMGEWSQNTFRDGLFKIPSLRNVAVSAPYMHDGRFQTLKEVVNHYNEGINNHPNLDWRLLDFNGAIRMNMSDYEVHSIVSFMESFTDLTFLQDPRFADPFQ